MANVYFEYKDEPRHNGKGGDRFKEKHVRTAVPGNKKKRFFDDYETRLKERMSKSKPVTENTLLCMTPDQQEALFMWIEKHKATELPKNPNEYKLISGIKVPGIIMCGEWSGGSKVVTAYGGGTFTFGFMKIGSGLKRVAITHLESWDTEGRFTFAKKTKVENVNSYDN